MQSRYFLTLFCSGHLYLTTSWCFSACSDIAGRKLLLYGPLGEAVLIGGKKPFALTWKVLCRFQAGATEVTRCYGFCATGGSNLLNSSTELEWSVAHPLCTGLVAVLSSSSCISHSIEIRLWKQQEEQNPASLPAGSTDQKAGEISLVCTAYGCMQLMPEWHPCKLI